jgi:hypothetical protein
MRNLAILSIIILLSNCIKAATPGQEARIQKLFEIMQLQRYYETNLIVGYCMATNDVKNDLSRYSEDVRKVILKNRELTKKRVFELSNWQIISKRLIEIYAKHFTEKDLDEIIPVIDNKAARKLFSKQIEMLADLKYEEQQRAEELQNKGFKQ